MTMIPYHLTVKRYRVGSVAVRVEMESLGQVGHQDISRGLWEESRASAMTLAVNTLRDRLRSSGTGTLSQQGETLYLDLWSVDDPYAAKERYPLQGPDAAT